ncbi:hypothetical protein V6Z11_D07G138600 [Gossypium hirsutum]
MLLLFLPNQQDDSSPPCHFICHFFFKTHTHSRGNINFNLSLPALIQIHPISYSPFLINPALSLYPFPLDLLHIQGHPQPGTQLFYSSSFFFLLTCAQDC